ncbi:MAG: zinc-dependent alcohol dehydrogenase family protein [Bacteroidota bacterium]
MKSVQFEALGLPKDILKVKDVATPEPGPGEVRVKVATCNINPSDVMFVQGLYGIRPELPAVGGFEAAGSIDKCGEGVELPVGMRVIFTAIGVWQEYVIVPAKTIIPTPEGMSDEIACQAFVNPYTAYGMLKESGLEAGQWLMLTAGGSAFGQFVIQLCKQKGINTLCTVRRDDQVEDLKALGATVVVNTEAEDLQKAVKEHTERRGVDYIFDAVGGTLGAKALDCLTQGGTMLVFGLLSLRPIPLNSGIMIFKDLTVKGFWLTTWMTSLNKEEKIEVTKAVLGMLATEQLKTKIEAKYGLDEVVKAVEHADSPGRTGKVILDLSL